MSHWDRLSSRPVIHHCGDLHSADDCKFPASVAIFSELMHIMDCILAFPYWLEPSGLILRLGQGLPLSRMLAISLFVCPGKRDCDVIRHETALHEHPGLISQNMKYTDERPWRTLKNLYHLSFTPMVIRLLAGDRHAHCVTIERTSCLRCLHKDIISIFHYYECKAFTGHLHSSGHCRKHLLGLLTTRPAVSFLS